MGRIYLIGIAGVGKSTLGQTLATVLNYQFKDLDTCVVENIQMSISDYFERYGEASFRALEQECLLKTEPLKNLVIACGGGIVELPENREWLKKQAMVIFLKRPIDTIIEDIEVRHRPLLKKGPEQLKLLYERRLPFYEEVASVSLEIDSLSAGVGNILDILKERGF